MEDTSMVGSLQEPTIPGIYYTLVQHVERERDMHEKVDKLHKTVVTGNGVPSLVETVRRHDTWIAGVNKIIWLLVSILLGQILLGGCSLVFALFMFLRDYLVQIYP